MTTSHDLTTTGTYVPVTDFERWMVLAEDAYRRLAEAFADVPDDRWDAATPCAGWTVRDLGGHLVGAMRSAASLRETLSQQRAVRRRVQSTGEQEVDALTAIQIERAAGLSPRGVVDEMARTVAAAVKGRSRMPGFVRRRAGFHVEMGTIDERWDMEYFLGCILTRDAWLHRVDLADALGTELELDGHDTEIVGDVAIEWVRRHGQPVHLTLTGVAGGTLETGEAGTEIELDAVQFCRIVSGRATYPDPLLQQEVPF